MWFAVMDKNLMIVHSPIHNCWYFL